MTATLTTLLSFSSADATNLVAGLVTAENGATVHRPNNAATPISG